ncbi:hypothetical protein ECG_07811 [Echinococcus granulosus]|uniref:Otopetrin 2 n=1 Tax=Echinococcus granulosus TaxID=6210 RepID=A0A068WXE0_ECHGR|nr:hypothetical protein ECG_07811 [Echinococcus granulosus]CDS22297.1 otopetrin 2 [Echinococcus granulosus]
MWEIKKISSTDGTCLAILIAIMLLTRTQSKKPTECQRSNKGLFIGLLLITGTLVGLTLVNTLLQQKSQCTALIIYQATDITLLFIGTGAVGVALFQMRVLAMRYLSEESALDANLLLVSLLGVLFYDLFILVPAAGANGNQRAVGLIFAGKAVLELLQSMLQVLLIVEASRRQVATSNQAAEKPGRTMITFLLILNLAMWILKTFELKHATTHPIYKSHYNELVWKVIISVSLLLVVFFHFHSTVCLADVWSCTYRFHNTASGK